MKKKIMIATCTIVPVAATVAAFLLRRRKRYISQ